MKHNFKLSAVSAAIMAVGIASPVFAAEEELSAIEVREQKKEEVEVIEVTGFKGSLHKSMNNKRFSDGVSDSIYAEDVGKSTDQNIADALSRVTGVTVEESDGEGSRISVRGAGADLNQISMNGVALTSNLSAGEGETSAGNGVDLGSFSADILSSIDVIKTSAADNDEGSLGATVILRTVQPLNLNAPRRMITAEARYNDFSGETTPRVSASFADKYFDEQFGFIVTLSGEETVNRTDRIQSNWEGAGIRVVDGLNGDNVNGTIVGHDYNNLTEDGTNGRLIRLKQEGQADEDLVGWDPANHIAYVEKEGGNYVMGRDQVNTQVNITTVQRFTANAGFQFRPTENIDIQLDLTHTQVERSLDNNTLQVNANPYGRYNVNTQYNGIDMQDGTIKRYRDTTMQGFLNRLEGTREQGTDVASLRYEHQLTDDLSMEVLAGYSKSTDDTDDIINARTATWGTTGNGLINAMSPDYVEAVGYECPDNCRSYFGTVQGDQDAATGRFFRASSRFNPLDLQANHLGQFNFTIDSQEDASASLFVNFDWALDNDYITSVEFGGKYATRTKEVYTQRQTLNNAAGGSLDDGTDGGFETVGMGDINLIDMLDTAAFPYDNVAEGLTPYRESEFYQGWPLISTQKALKAWANSDDDSITVKGNNLGSREITTDTTAVYAKINFEFLDGRLTGNIGGRYVNDDTEAQGYSGLTYSGGAVYDPTDLFVTRGLGDIENETKPWCPEGVTKDDDPQGISGPANAEDYNGCRDWKLTHAYQNQQPNSFARDGLDDAWLFGDIEVNRLVNVEYDAAGNFVRVIQNGSLPSNIYNLGDDYNAPATHPTNQADFRVGNANTGITWQYLDFTTSDNGDESDRDNLTNRQGIAKDTGGFSQFLPSLNINYQVNDTQIARFAVSTTMTRANFDSLNPRTEVREAIWEPRGGGISGNTNLQPLKSNNLDVSYEWYFDETGMVSGGLFYKDMNDFEARVATRYQYADYRTEYDRDDFSELLLDFDETRTPANSNCMPKRVATSNASTWDINKCQEVDIGVLKNGDGASIAGLELAYQQNYEMLPGLLSGLGLSANYTYQKSEQDPTLVGGLLIDNMPVNFTPEHSGNLTLFWEHKGLELRLANRYSGLQVVDSTQVGYTEWQDAQTRMDFSSSYQINKMFSITFQATNLTDNETRRWIASSQLTNGDDSVVVSNEGNAFENSVSDTKERAVYKSGRQFRLGVRASF